MSIEDKVANAAMNLEDRIVEWIRDIHQVIVKKKPAEDDLLAAAVAVVQIRYSDKEWADLDAAIGELASVCMRAGIKFNNPRIDQ